MSKWDYSFCGTGHAFQLQFLFLITCFNLLFFASLESTETKWKKRTGVLHSSDSPCVCFFPPFFFYFTFSSSNFGHSKQHERASSYFIEHCAPCHSGGSTAGATQDPGLSHSVTGQLSPSSEVVNEHRHTVCTHQVVWVSRKRFVLPGFGITCRKQ